MKVKVFSNPSEKKLEKEINRFIESEEIEVNEIQFSAHISGFAAMIIYKQISE